MWHIQLLFLLQESLLCIVLVRWGHGENCFSVFKFRDLIRTVDSSAEVTNNPSTHNTTENHAGSWCDLCVARWRLFASGKQHLGKKSFYFLLFLRRKGEGSEGHDKTTQVMMFISWSSFHEKFIPHVFG